MNQIHFLVSRWFLFFLQTLTLLIVVLSHTFSTFLGESLTFDRWLVIWNWSFIFLNQFVHFLQENEPVSIDL